jgi:hypothetical protein
VIGNEERCASSLPRLRFGLFDLCRFVAYSDALVATSRRFRYFAWQTAWLRRQASARLSVRFSDELQRQG